MQLSSRGRYAVMAMVEMAARQNEPASRPVTLGEIAAAQQMSLCYLEQLFGGLRRAGLVISARGPGGGYRLGRLSSDVSVAEVLLAVEEPLRATRCDESMAGCLRGPKSGEGEGTGASVRCRTHDLWAELGCQIELFFGSVTLEQIVAGKVRGRAAPLREPVTAA